MRKALAQEPAIAARGVAEALADPRSREALSAEWRRWRAQRSGRQAAGEAFEAGALSPAVIAALRQEGIAVSSAQVVVTDAELAHLEHDDKRARDAALDDADLDRLPEILASPKAVLRDTAEDVEGDWLVFAFDPRDGGREAGKVTVRANFTRKVRDDDGRRRRAVANDVRSAGYVRWGNLRERRYVVLYGALEE